MDGMIIFHAKMLNDVKPNHTIGFTLKDNKLLCAYSVPHPKLDQYSKSIGRICVQRRLLSLMTKLDTLPVMSARQNIRKIIPRKVLVTLEYYIRKALKYFKLRNDTQIIIQGQYVNWEERNKDGRLVNKYRSVIIPISLDKCSVLY